MTAYRPRTLQSDFIIRPDCPKCGKHMNLFEYSWKSRVTNCKRSRALKCSHVETAIEKIA